MADTLTSTQKVRHAMWIELFFDLVYVVALAKLTHIIVVGHDGHIGSHEYILYFTLFVPVWWSWIGHTMFANRFGKYDATDRVLTLLQMFFCIFLSLGISGLEKSPVMFAMAYAGTRFSLVLMYVRVHVTRPEARPATRRFITGFSIGALLWLFSLLLPEPYMYMVWVIGLIIELMTPISMRERLKKVPLNNHHLPERFGLFALLVMGESIHSMVTGIYHKELTTPLVLTLILAFVATCTVWWLYFATLDNVFKGKLEGAAQLCVYGHLPIYMGIGLFAAGIQRLVAGGYSVAELNLIFCFSLLLILIPLQMIHFQFIQHVTRGSFLKRGIIFVASLTILNGLGQLSNSVYFVFFMIFLLVAYIYSERKYVVSH